MLDTIWTEIKGILKSRLFPMSIIFFVLFFLLVRQIFNMQIVHGDEFAQQAEITGERIRDLKSTRGNIYDRNGVLLAYDELSYAVTIEDVGAFSNNEDKNAMIYHLIQLLEENKSSIVTDFPIALNEDGEFYFTVEGSSLVRFKKDIYSLTASQKLSDSQIAATAADMFEYIRYSSDANSPKFLISEEYSDEDALKIMSVRYELFLNRWQKYVQSTIATNVNKKAVSAIKEAGAELPGVDIMQETHRVYNDSEYFAHILGYTGVITSDEYDKLEEDDKEKYTRTDQVGKTGLEKEYENYLHGEKGSEKLIINENFRVVDIKDRTEPTAGNDLYLTIDANYQKKYYNILERKLADILLSKIVNSMSYGSKGVSRDDITIPIYEVYYSLIHNHVIDVMILNDDDATEVEQRVYKKYKHKLKDVQKSLKKYLDADNTISNKAAGKEMQEYLDYYYSFLLDQKIIISEDVDEESDVFKNYKDDKISLSEFLQYALSNKWIDLTKLNIGDEFYSTKELYNELISYANEIIVNDVTFNEMIYRTMIFNYSLSGTDICLLLYDQGVIEYDESMIEKLENGSISAYDFIREKLKKLEITPGQLALDPCSGSIVVTDVNTGDVLALVSYPGYDNNKMANQIDSKYYSNLLNNSGSPLMNRPLQQKTAPGSTYKPLVAVAALEEGVITGNDKILDKVVFEKISQGPKCNGSHGTIDVTDALQVSCNYFFYEMGWQFGKSGENYNSNQGLRKLKKYATMFGLGEKSGIELFEYEPHISDEDAIRSSIGQGTNSYTPAQISRYVTTIANKGTCYNLTIIDKIKNLDGDVLLDNSASVLNNVSISNNTWSLVHEGMYKVLNGPRSSLSGMYKDLGVTVAGKTGTAQESKSRPNHALFVSFAPYEDPEISVVVVIPNGYTSGNSAEVAKNIYKSYFKLSNKKENETEEPENGEYVVID